MPDRTREPELLRLWVLLVPVATGSVWLATSVSDTVARAGTGEAVCTEAVPVMPPIGGGSGSESGR